jgi:hypothetical protein
MPSICTYACRLPAPGAQQLGLYDGLSEHRAIVVSNLGRATKNGCTLVSAREREGNMADKSAFSSSWNADEERRFEQNRIAGRLIGNTEEQSVSLPAVRRQEPAREPGFLGLLFGNDTNPEPSIGDILKTGAVAAVITWGITEVVKHLSEGQGTASNNDA